MGKNGFNTMLGHSISEKVTEEMEDDIAYESYLQAEENDEENELDDYDHDIE